MVKVVVAVESVGIIEVVEIFFAVEIGVVPDGLIDIVTVVVGWAAVVGVELILAGV
jgi:hypothetical protein